MRSQAERIAILYGGLVLWGALAETLGMWLAAFSAGVICAVLLYRPFTAARAAFAALLLVVHVRWCLLDWMIVDGPSMQPALPAGTAAIVLKQGAVLPPVTPFMHGESLRRLGAPSVERGSVVVIRYPGLDVPAPSRIVKRIAGLPGDAYEFRDERLFVNAVLFRENITPAPRRLQPPPSQIPAAVSAGGPLAEYAAAGGVPARGQVPENMLLVIGDNPDESRDSRSIGFVPASFIEGRVLGPGGAVVSNAQ